MYRDSINDSHTRIVLWLGLFRVVLLCDGYKEFGLVDLRGSGSGSGSLSF